MSLPLTPEYRDLLYIIQIAASLASAAGTFCAVAVALHLARRDKRQRLSVEAGVSYYVEDGQSLAEGVPFLSMTGTNTGFIPITVKSIFWRIGTFRRKRLYQIPPVGGNTTPLPKELTHGQQLWINGEMRNVIPGFFYLFEEIRKFPITALALRSLKCGLETSTGKRCLAKPTRDLQRRLAAAYTTHLQDHPNPGDTPP